MANRNYQIESTWPIIANISCGGEEERFIDCNFGFQNSTCSHRQDASVICQGNILSDVILVGNYRRYNSMENSGIRGINSMSGVRKNFSPHKCYSSKYHSSLCY